MKFNKGVSRINFLSGLRKETPLFGLLTVEKNMKMLAREILYQPRICLYYSINYIALQTPVINLEWSRDKKKGDVIIKLGRSWHHLFHDLKCHGLIGFIKHVKKY